MRFSTRTTLAALAVFVLILAGSIFVLTKSWQRWDIDSDWARQIVLDAKELQARLDEYRSANGEFPGSLNEFDAQFTNPTGFDGSTSTDGWQYRKLNKSDYQLFAIGTSFGSTYDAMVLRHSAKYPLRWFRSLDSSHDKEFGDWRYITGFSQFENDP